jgi:N-acetylglucosamine kinase-like BadF-type ATPase
MAGANEIITPDQLRHIAEEKDMERARGALAHLEKKEDEEKKLREMFMEREVHPEAKARVSEVVRRAAERGENEILAIRFASTWCSDRGRAINNVEPDWPTSLTGFAARAYEFYDKELRPHGYKLRAEVLDFPGGMPGEIGIFLRW